LSAEEVRQEAERLEEQYKNLFHYLVSEDSMVLRKQNTKGLGLSKVVLSKIFSENYLRYLKESN